MRSDKSVMYSLIERKQDNLRKRLLNKFHINFTTIEYRLRQYSKLIHKPVPQWNKLDCTRALDFCICNCGPRKNEVQDPYIEFLEYRQYVNRLNAISATIPSFRFGDENSDIIINDTEAALKTFREENIIVQIGTSKDKNQRYNKYLVDGQNDSRYVENAVIFKPCLMFSAKVTIIMINKIREFLNMSVETRPAGKNAKLKIGAMISSRSIKKVIEQDWNELFLHAERNSFQIGSHIFRKVYCNAIISPELKFIENIRSMTGKFIDPVVLASHVLRHQGSFSTVQSYSNVKVTFDLQPQVLVTPDITLLRQLLERMSNMESELRLLTEANKELTKQNHEMAVESESNSKIDAMYAVLIQHKKHVKNTDEYIRLVIYTLKQNDIKVTKNNIMKAKIGSSIYSLYKKNNKDNLLPENWTPPATILQNTIKRKADIDDADNTGKLDLPYGYKVIVPQNTKHVTNKKKQKLIDQRNLQKIKRDEETFGKNNITMQCDDDKDVVKDHKFAPKLHRDLCQV